MCQDCYSPDSYADDDLGYDDQDDDWGDDGYPEPDDDWPGDRDDLDDDYDEMRGCWPEPPDPWDYRPSLLERVMWRVRDWRRRLDLRRHPDRYFTEPPF